jgi:tetratricopeptide (TPR) repeat protein
MHPVLRSATPVALSLILAGRLAAQADHTHAGEHLGHVVFPTSCRPDAQQRFERAMALLHSFWWEEAGRAFRGVAAADSTCAMAYWGLAVTAWGNPFAGGPGADNLRAGAAAATRALALGAPTAREGGFLAAVGALYRDYATVPNSRRLEAYSDTLARVYRDVPDDPEVAMYYALSLVATASPTDTSYGRQQAAAAILNPLFRRFPEHPGLAHYIIHANDSPQLAYLGLDAARRYAQIAPSAPHAQHMPSHIFIRLGLWDETIAANERSLAAGAHYADAEHRSGVGPDPFHALDYLVYGYLQEGRDTAAERSVAHGVALAALAPAELLLTIYNYNIVAMEARVPLERGDWAAAAALPVRAAGHGDISEALARFTRAVGAVRSGATAQARAEVQALATIETALAGHPGYNWSHTVGIERQAVGAWLLLTDGDTAAALREAKSAADREDVTAKHPVTPGELVPARELEADLLLRVGLFARAQAAYDMTLKREPGRARSLFGAAQAAAHAGDAATARVRYQDYLTLMQRADGTRPELGVARAFLASR